MSYDAKDLIIAIKNGNSKKVHDIIRFLSNSTIIMFRSNGFSPLFYAVQSRNIEILQLLIPTISYSKNPVDMTPFLTAIKIGWREGVKLLCRTLYAGYINYTLGGDIPIIKGILNGDEEIITILCRYYPILNMMMTDSETILEYAVKHCSHKVVSTLLSSGADPNWNNRPLLKYAMKQEDIKMCRILIQAGLNVSDGSALIEAINSKLIKLIPDLLSAGANPNYSENGTNPLSKCISEVIPHQDRVKCIDLLLKYGADVNSVSPEDGDSPLTSYLSYDYDPGDIIFDLLIEAGANVNHKNGNEDTPLYLAAGTASDHIVETLINRGADVNAANSEGDTPLHIAAEWGNVFAVSKIIDAGANVNAENIHGRTPLCSLINGFFNAIEGGWDIGVERYLQCIDILYSHGANPEIPDENGETPLTKASGYREHEPELFDPIVEKLLTLYQ